MGRFQFVKGIDNKKNPKKYLQHSERMDGGNRPAP